jgi:site-specific recombinase XerD
MSKKQLSLRHAVQGYLLYAESKRLSPHTIRSYKYAFKKLTRRIDDETLLTEISISDLTEFLASLTTLSNKTIHNIHSALSSMWKWAVKLGYADENPLSFIERPKPEKREIIPLVRDDLVKLLKACDKARSYTRPGKAECSNSRPTALRDRAIILTLVDTGMRATELCEMTIADFSIDQRQALVMGKGKKERLLPMAPQTVQAIWRYLATRNPDLATDEPLFATRTGRHMDRHGLRHMLVGVSERAGVPGVHPHRFRHTFAINFLRNGGNIYALQRLLGHTTLDMVKRYLSIAQADIDAAHKHASPVANWKL